MFTDLETEIRTLIFDLCEVLVRHGISQVSVGALMRLIGVADEVAASHDADLIDIDSNFITFAREYYTVTNHHLGSSSIQ